MSDHEKIIERIQKGEAKIERIDAISQTLKSKVRFFLKKGEKSVLPHAFYTTVCKTTVFMVSRVN